MTAGKLKVHKQKGGCYNAHPKSVSSLDSQDAGMLLEPIEHDPSYRSNKRQFSVFFITTILTLTVALLSVTLQAVLYKQYNELKAEVEAQIEILEAYRPVPQGSKTVSQDDVTGDASDVTDVSGVVARQKRADNTPRRNNDNRNRNRARHQHGRNSNLQVAAAHFDINTNHPDIPANGELKTGPRGSVIKFWKKSDNLFTNEQNVVELDTSTGELTVNEAGLYYIYTQMTYFDRSGRWSHLVTINDLPFIKCLASEWGIEEDPDTGVLYNTIHQCHTAALAYIRKNQKIAIRSMYPERVIHADKDMTFFGLMKLS